MIVPVASACRCGLTTAYNVDFSLIRLDDGPDATIEFSCLRSGCVGVNKPTVGYLWLAYEEQKIEGRMHYKFLEV